MSRISALLGGAVETTAVETVAIETRSLEIRPGPTATSAARSPRAVNAARVSVRRRLDDVDDSIKPYSATDPDWGGFAGFLWRAIQRDPCGLKGVAARWLKDPKKESTMRHWMPHLLTGKASPPVDRVIEMASRMNEAERLDLYQTFVGPWGIVARTDHSQLPPDPTPRVTLRCAIQTSAKVGELLRLTDEMDRAGACDAVRCAGLVREAEAVREGADQVKRLALACAAATEADGSKGRRSAAPGGGVV